MSRIAYIKELKTWESEFKFYSTVTVRFSETDMFGHLNNTVPFTYFELARIDYFNALGFMNEWTNPKNETIPVVANLQCDFLKQVYYNQTLRIYVKAVNVGSSSVDLHYMGKTEEGDIAFTGQGTIVQISRYTGRSVPWNEESKKLFI